MLWNAQNLPKNEGSRIVWNPPPRKKIVEEKPPKAVVGVVVVRYLSALFTTKQVETANQVMHNFRSCLTEHENQV